jgi:hypothetical protein
MQGFKIAAGCAAPQTGPESFVSSCRPLAGGESAQNRERRQLRAGPVGGPARSLKRSSSVSTYRPPEGGNSTPSRAGLPLDRHPTSSVSTYRPQVGGRSTHSRGRGLQSGSDVHRDGYIAPTSGAPRSRRGGRRAGGNPRSMSGSVRASGLRRTVRRPARPMTPLPGRNRSRFSPGAPSTRPYHDQPTPSQHRGHPAQPSTTHAIGRLSRRKLTLRPNQPSPTAPIRRVRGIGQRLA